jgi:glutamate--cysteine ligase
VPAAVATALAGDERAADVAMAAAEPVWAGNEHGLDPRSGAPFMSGDPWLRAARSGPADPRISRASRACFEAADAALGRAGAPAPIRRAVAEFTERYVLQDRCPAHDQLEAIT